MSGEAPASSVQAAAERCAAGNHGLAVADLEHAAEEIQHVRVGLEAGDGDRLAHGFGGFAVELGEAQIEAAERGIGEEGLDEFGAFLVLGGRSQ